MSDHDPRVLEGALPPAENTALFGHAPAQDFLAQAYRSGKPHHAILIEGPEGIGKATLAFRFANHVLCNPDPLLAPDEISNPDPQSPFFRQIAGGASHNLVHLARPIDEKNGKLKTTITVDEVRKAGKFFSQTSGTGNWRIVVLDTADDLNRNAANAILKILEEPPKGAMFLVISHNSGRLLPTIRSRCLPLRLRSLDDVAMTYALTHLGLAGAMSPKLLEAAGGSVARAIKLINYGGIDVIAAFEALMASHGPSQRREMHVLADALAGKDKEIIFDFFADHVGKFLLGAARQSALVGQLGKADRLARLHATISERLAIAESYNLDRKQTVLSLLGDISTQFLLN